MRKFLVILMSAVMVLCLATPAMADNVPLAEDGMALPADGVLASAVQSVLGSLENADLAVGLLGDVSDVRNEPDEENTSDEVIYPEADDSDAPVLAGNGALPVTLVIGNVTVTEENMDDVLGDGTVSYDEKTNTLTLNGANISVSDGNYGIRNDGALNITLKGVNRILCAGVYGLYSTDDIIINGSGSLEVRGSDLGICIAGGYEVGGLTICGDASVTAVGGDVTSGSSFGVRVDDVLTACDNAVLIAKAGTAPDRSCGIFAYDVLEISDNASVTTEGSDLPCLMETDSYGIRATHVVVNGGELKAIGGTAGSCNGIFTSTFDMYGGTVTAVSGDTEGQGPTVGLQANKTLNLSGGNLEASGGNAGDDRSCGVLTDGGTVNILGGSMVAQGGEANYSYGLKALDLTISGGYVTAVAGQGSWCSSGISAENSLTVSGGYVRGDGDSAQNFSYGIQATSADITGGEVRAFAGSADQSYGLWAFSHANILCEEVRLSQHSPSFNGTTVTLGTENGCALYVFGDVVLDDSLTVSEPEAGQIRKGSEQAPDCYALVDGNGVVAKNGVIEPLIYKVAIKGLAVGYSQAAKVPAGQSLNETYCDVFGVEDFSEMLNTEKPGFTFAGWYTESGDAFDFDMPVNADMTIYARWTEEVSGGGSDGMLSPETGDPGLWGMLRGIFVVLAGIL